MSPYSDPAKQAEAQRRYRRKDLRRVREAERKRKQAQRAQAQGRRVEELDEKPLACFHRFFASNPCRKKARYRSPTGARWCDEHAEGDLIPIVAHSLPTRSGT